MLFNLLEEFVKILPACVFLRILLDACRNYILKIKEKNYG